MTYCKNYCEEKGISTSQLNEAQKTLYYVAENMKMDKSISEEGYRHFQIAIKALEKEPCEDAVSKNVVLKILCDNCAFDKPCGRENICANRVDVIGLPTTTPTIIHCKDCDHYEKTTRLCTKHYDEKVFRQPNWFCGDSVKECSVEQ